MSACVPVKEGPFQFSVLIVSSSRYPVDFSSLGYVSRVILLGVFITSHVSNLTKSLLHRWHDFRDPFIVTPQDRSVLSLGTTSVSSG